MNGPQNDCSPVRWRQALVTWLQLAFVVSAIRVAGRSLFESMPAPLDSIALTGAVVAVMTWLVVPATSPRLIWFLSPSCPR